MLIPKKAFITTGIGQSEDKLLSYEFALRQAGTNAFNLVPVSSIIPENCEIIDKQTGLQIINQHQGSILFVVESKTQIFGQGSAYSSITIVKPSNTFGYVYESPNKELNKVEIAKRFLYTKTRENIKDLKTYFINSLAKGESNVWTTSVSQAVFIL